MRKRNNPAILLLVAVTACCGTFMAASDIPEYVVAADIGDKMNTYLSRLAAFGFHGAVLAAKDGKILLHNAYGVAQVHTGVKNHTGILFSTGSVTKQFTAAAIMHLEMNGMLSTADPITEFFDNVPEEKKGITIHHLLTHSSGFPGEFGPDNESITRDELMHNMLNSPLAYTAGDHYEYSNAGFSMLAAIVEIVSGEEYEQYLKNNLFMPSGMNHTGLKLLDVNDTLVSHSHHKGLGYPSPLERPDDYFHLKGNGGILSTTADMYRWHLALLGNDLLSEEVKKKMFTPHIREYEGEESYYGYGWVVQKSSRGTTVCWHNGGAMPHGWSCAVYRYVDDSAVFIVFANKPMDGMMPVDHIVAGLAGILFGLDIDLPPEIVSVSANKITRFEGKYLLPDSGAFIVTSADGMLRVAPVGQEAVAAMFPSPYAPMLPKYNGKTTDLVNLLAQHRFDEATGYFSQMSPDDDWAAMAREWWQLFDSLGDFQSVDVIGTAGGGGAKTYCRLNFSAGSVTCRFFWMSGMCEGMISEVEELTKEFAPLSQSRFVGYSLSTGATVSVEFPEDGTLFFVSGAHELRAKRSN